MNPIDDPALKLKAASCVNELCKCAGALRQQGHRTLDFMEATSAVPTESGGLQFEWHRDGWDIEIELDANDKIVGVLVACEPRRANG